MLAKRIIPCLDVKDGRVVKGIHFVSLRDAGDRRRVRLTPTGQSVVGDDAHQQRFGLRRVDAEVAPGIHVEGRRARPRCLRRSRAQAGAAFVVALGGDTERLDAGNLHGHRSILQQIELGSAQAAPRRRPGSARSLPALTLLLPNGSEVGSGDALWY